MVLKLLLEILVLTRELIPVRNPAGIRSDSDRIRSDSGRIPAGIIGKMKKYFIFLKKYLFKQKCDYNFYC
jgi:hypothetical protein